MSRLTVAVDARPLSNPQPGGFRSYLRALLRGIAERDAAGEPTPRLLLYLDRPLTGEVEGALPDGTKTRLLSRDRLRTDWRLWDSQVRADSPDLVFGCQNYLPRTFRVPSVLVVHDAMGIKQCSWDRHTPRTLKERLINRYWHYQTIASSRKASRIITVSQGARREISSVLTDIPDSRFAVVYNGVNLPAPRFAGEREPNTLLCIASPDRRKNLDLFYDALATHREKFGAVTPSLRIVCTSLTTAERTETMLRKYNLDAELHVAIDDQALSELYARASIFVWTSRQEGFGLPPLEMMSTGGAVASSDAPCMPEVLGDVPLYFPTYDARAVAESVRTLLQDPELRRERGEQGRSHAATFTCRRMADETVAVWEQAVTRTV